MLKLYAFGSFSLFCVDHVIVVYTGSMRSFCTLDVQGFLFVLSS